MITSAQLPKIMVALGTCAELIARIPRIEPSSALPIHSGSPVGPPKRCLVDSGAATAAVVT